MSYEVTKTFSHEDRVIEYATINGERLLPLLGIRSTIGDGDWCLGIPARGRASAMNVVRQHWNIVWRSTFYDLELGMLAGSAFGTITVLAGTIRQVAVGRSSWESMVGNVLGIALFGGGTGMFFGALVGLGLGLLNGVILATWLQFMSLPGGPRNPVSIRLGSALVSGLVALAAFPLVLHAVDINSIAPEAFDVDILFLAMAIVAATAGFWGSDRVLRWYIGEAG